MARPLLTNRREFLARASAAAAALLAACRGTEPVPEDPYARLRSRPSHPTRPITAGYHELRLHDLRDGFFYVPRSYSALRPAPLLVLLHGGNGSDREWRTESVAALMEDLGVVLLAPESAAETWDFPLKNRYDQDPPFIDSALAVVFDHCHIDPTAIALAGFSDGATEALGLGVINGDLFSSVMAFSPGGLQVPFHRGRPRVLVTHGKLDTVLSPVWTRDFIVPELERMGLAVEFIEYLAGHRLPANVFDPAIRAYVG
jgi:predicted esterase